MSNYHIIKELHNSGFVWTKLTDTLQGSIWRATSQDDAQKSYVLKIQNQYLAENPTVVVNNKAFKVKENIINEASTLRYLTQNTNPPQNLVRYQSFLKTDGGYSLFDFVLKVHKLIAEGKIEISEWHKVTKVIFKQMIECIDYIHSMNVNHFDISLENLLINDVEIQRCGNNEKIVFLTDDIQIKLCDFGLAQVFDGKQNYGLAQVFRKYSNFKYDKFCGNPKYKSPEIRNKKIFSAKSNDIWCLGVCFFMVIIGVSPWNRALTTDESFNIDSNFIPENHIDKSIVISDKKRVEIFTNQFVTLYQEYYF